MEEFTLLLFHFHFGAFKILLFNPSYAILTSNMKKSIKVISFKQLELISSSISMIATSQ